MEIGGAEVIKSFLVGLGFGVDDASLSKFNKSITSATLRVSALYAATKIAAAGIVKGISEVSKSFEQMGYEYHIIAPAINKALVLRRELLKSYQLAGINIRKVVKDSINLNLSLTKTRFAFEAIYKSVASRFFEQLTKRSDAFRASIYANMPKIQRALEGFVKFVFKALEVTDILGRRIWSILTRVYDFFVQLDDATNGWSTKILAAVAAWYALNLAFLATPLGAILAGLVAILALYDDFKVWQEGGESFFNWSKFVPVIDAVGTALSGLWQVLQGVGLALFSIVNAFVKLLSLDVAGFWAELGRGGDRIIDTFKGLLDVLKGVGSIFPALASWGLQTFGNAEGKALGANIGSAIAPNSAPLGAGSSSSLTNQNVNQQTTVHIQGVPDANGAGNAVAGVMAKQNFDLVRNMRGSVRPGGIIP